MSNRGSSATWIFNTRLIVKIFLASICSDTVLTSGRLDQLMCDIHSLCQGIAGYNGFVTRQAVQRHPPPQSSGSHDIWRRQQLLLLYLHLQVLETAVYVRLQPVDLLPLHLRLQILLQLVVSPRVCLIL